MVNPISNALSDIREAKRDRAFMVELARLGRTGTLVGATLGLIAILLYLGIHVVIMGESLGWRQAEGVVALWDKSILAVMCAVGIVLSRHVTLTGAQLLIGFIVVAGSVASVTDDIMNGDTSFAPGYVTVIYLLGVIAAPYRPGQTFLLGGAIIGATYCTIEFMPAIVGVSGIRHTRGHDAYLFIITVILSGVSGLLYVSRYRQYAAHKKLRAVEETKSRFFTNISHEFRTPLTLLLGPLEDTLRGWYGPIGNAFRRRVREMHTQALELHGLINQLLDLSKLDVHSVTLSVREQDLVAFVEREVEHFRSALERKNISLHVEKPEAPVKAWIDREWLQRVLSNLMSNALKYTPQEGTVRVRVGQSDSQAMISVRDTGVGLSAEALSSVFDRFATSERARDGQPSTGIGLALVKEIVERHGGEVEAISERGFGAEFVVRLRLGADHFPPEDIAAAEDESPYEVASESMVLEDEPELDDADTRGSAGDAPIVLVADDHAAMRAYIREVLGEEYRILEAADGAEAWTIVQERNASLVISDVIMPNIDGIELCRRIREHEMSATTPLVLVTARTGEDARIEAYRAGADAYLSKPFSGEELRVISENLIEIRRHLEERTKMPDWIQPKQASIPSHEAEFLNRVQQVIAEHIGDSQFGVEWLADEVGLSPRQLQRRLKKLIRLTAAGLTKTMRLEHAGRLLSETDLQVQEVARAVGYEDANYFSQLFRQVYGVPPSEYPKK